MTEHNGQSHRSPAEIEREIEQTRSQIEGTLGQLQQDLAHNEISERASNYVQRAKKVSDMASSIGRTAKNSAMPLALVGLGVSNLPSRFGRAARDNPMRLALIGAGLTWLAMSMRKRSHAGEEHYETEGYTYEEEMAPPYEPYYGIGYVEGDGHEEGRVEHAKQRLQGAKERASERLGHTKERTQMRAQGVKESAKHRLEGAKSRLSGATERAKGTMSSAKSRASDVSMRARENARRMGSNVRYRASRASSQARERFSEQPLLIGLVGFVAGLVIGAAMPVSRREQRMLGPARDRLLSRADEMATERIREAGDRVERSVSGENKPSSGMDSSQQRDIGGPIPGL